MAVADGWPSACGDTGAQNPAYRPARPPPELASRAMRGDGGAGEHQRWAAAHSLRRGDLLFLAELIRRTGAHVIGSVDDLQCGTSRDIRQMCEFRRSPRL
jgi:hypothetical protein